MTALASSRWAATALFFMNGVIFATWVSRIPAIQKSLGMSDGLLGGALLFMALGALVAMPVAGNLSSRFGSAVVCGWSCVVFFAGLPVLALAPNPWTLMAGLFVFGMGHGALDVAMNAQAVVVEIRYEKPIMSSFHALFSLGGLTGAALGGVIAELGTRPRVHFGAVGVILALVTFVYACPRLLRDTAVQEVKKTPFTWPSSRLIMLGIIAFCVLMGEGAMADWSAIYLEKVTGSSEGLAAAGYAAFSVTMAAGRFGGDALTARFGPVKLVRWGGLLSAAGLAGALIFANPVIAIVGLAAVGLGYSTVVPQVFTAAGRVKDMEAGPALAAVSTMGYFGFLIGPPLIGFLAEGVTLRMALVLIVLTSLVLTILASRTRS